MVSGVQVDDTFTTFTPTSHRGNISSATNASAGKTCEHLRFFVRKSGARVLITGFMRLVVCLFFAGRAFGFIRRPRDLLCFSWSHLT